MVLGSLLLIKILESFGWLFLGITSHSLLGSLSLCGSVSWSQYKMGENCDGIAFAICCRLICT